MRLITLDDIIETYTKFRQRGLPFITSKLNLNNIKRTKSAFNELNIQSANWWIIPKVRKRWNTIITGNPNTEPEEFVMKRFFREDKNLKMLSLGSGLCTHELAFATYHNFEEILCIDISDRLLKQASIKASEENLKNIFFKVKNLYDYEFPENYFDIVYFHASLHHFKDIDQLLREQLKNNGKLIIDEFVGPDRLQFPKHQITKINEALHLIPKPYRKRFKLDLYKNKVYGSGIIRMILADPSECVESSQITPSIHNNYQILYEASYGGNILANVLKDLAHHFMELDEEKEKVLSRLFEFEDEYLKNNPSDFVFGVYLNKKK
ncbi:class I SAM-dependent methyltransferase [Aquimarina sp. SS2-1]|uniref:class I SAM-dependent methyltransferase n=1 Tax=Aquimarina besae TaxID=3342247 RepID=UPI00366B95FC